MHEELRGAPDLDWLATVDQSGRNWHGFRPTTPAPPTTGPSRTAKATAAAACFYDEPALGYDPPGAVLDGEDEDDNGGWHEQRHSAI